MRYAIDEKLLPPTGWARPWEALPMALHRWINWGQREYMTQTAVLLYYADIVLRVIGTLFSAGLVFYLSVVSRLGRDSIDPADWFMWLVLGAWYVGITLLVVVSLWGRFETFDRTLTEQDIRTTSDLRLPLLLWNYQSFGLDRWYGVLAAVLVSAWQVLYAGGWAVLLYECATRALSNDDYEGLWLSAWCFALVQMVVTALARSASFSKLRALTSKFNDEPNAVERVRITLACLYIFWTTTVVLPLALAGLAYVLVS